MNDNAADRSSDLQAPDSTYSPLLPSPRRASASMRLSFLLTAAGQFRIFTGFPLGPDTGPAIDSGGEINTERNRNPKELRAEGRSPKRGGHAVAEAATESSQPFAHRPEGTVRLKRKIASR